MPSHAYRTKPLSPVTCAAISISMCLFRTICHISYQRAMIPRCWRGCRRATATEPGFIGDTQAPNYFRRFLAFLRKALLDFRQTQGELTFTAEKCPPGDATKEQTMPADTALAHHYPPHRSHAALSLDTDHHPPAGRRASSSVSGKAQPLEFPGCRPIPLKREDLVHYGRRMPRVAGTGN